MDILEKLDSYLPEDDIISSFKKDVLSINPKSLYSEDKLSELVDNLTPDEYISEEITSIIDNFSELSKPNNKYKIPSKKFKKKKNKSKIKKLSKKNNRRK